MSEDLKQKSAKDNSKKLLELVSEFGSLHKISDNQLAMIGFIRDGTGRVVNENVSKQEAEAREKEKFEASEKMKDKIKNSPFGIIEIELEQNGLNGKRVQNETIERMRDFMVDCEYELENGWMSFVIPENRSFWDFKKDFEKYVSKKESTSGEKNFLKKNIFHNGPACSIVMNYFDKFKKECSMEEYVDYREDTTNVITPENAETFYYDLERTRSKLTDIDQLKKEFGKCVKESWLEVGDPKIFSLETISHHRKRHDTTLENFFLCYFMEFLQQKGFEKVVEEISGLRTFEELSEKLKKMKADVLPSFDKERNIKKLLKKASGEERRELSQEKKEISGRRKYEKKIIDGLMECISQYEFVGTFYNKIIKKIQSELVVKDGGTRDAKIYLDGTPDPKYDKDPGAVSGDCTEGSPLPFEIPDCPIYNVKAFNGRHEHIGNIYLFSTRTFDNKKCWHLDAIQIPCNIDWKASIAKIIEKIGLEAETKNVDIITINKQPKHVSNYDYIQDATLGYQKEKNLGEEKIVSFEEIMSEKADLLQKHYSSIQGDSVVFVVWRRQISESINNVNEK